MHRTKDPLSTSLSPRVTVFIPAFNAEKYISEAIISVLSQTYNDFELLIIDDGSSDDTPHIIAEYQDDPRVRIVRYDKNTGRPRVRNEGVKLARGELIAFLDADDRCLPERLRLQVNYLDTHKDIDGVGTWMTVIDENGIGSERAYYREPLDPDTIACGMLYTCPLSQGSMMVRREAISHHQYDVSFPIAEDYDLWVRMIRTCRFANLAMPLTQYRWHATQSSTAEIEFQNTLARSIEKRQLDALGIPADESDLVRHECLFRRDGRRPVLEKTGAPLDISYLRWARMWLGALYHANKKTKSYPEPSLSYILASCWLFACRKTARNSPWRSVVVEMSKPPLLRLVATYGISLFRNKVTMTRRFYNANRRNV